MRWPGRIPPRFSSIGGVHTAVAALWKHPWLREAEPLRSVGSAILIFWDTKGQKSQQPGTLHSTKPADSERSQNQSERSSCCLKQHTPFHQHHWRQRDKCNKQMVSNTSCFLLSSKGSLHLYSCISGRSYPCNCIYCVSLSRYVHSFTHEPFMICWAHAVCQAQCWALQREQ